MVEPVATAPAFGEADLSNCEREQIHLAGSIQPNGALLVVREPDGVILQASANAASFLGLRGTLLGRPLGSLPGNLLERITPHLGEPLDLLPIAVRCRVGHAAALFDALLHRPPAGGLIIELEAAGAPFDPPGVLEPGLRTLRSAASLRALLDDAARVFREVTLYDRVMVYRFDQAGHGEVVSEERRPDLEAFLGNRYPASDIPQIARRLYERNRVRVLTDIDYAPVPLTPVLSPVTGGPLDMSLCVLRSISPIHVQYLKNMGVSATLVASLMVGGRLWGLVSCHHYAPRQVRYEIRAVAELLAEALATRIAALESFAQGQAELGVRRLEQRMIEAISRKGDWRSALFDNAQALLGPLGAEGAALLFEGEVLTTGQVPGTPQLRAISAWLDEEEKATLYATGSLGLDVPRFAALRGVASGVVAVPVGEAPGEYLIWFRPERVRTVVWGGNPFKPVVTGDDPRDLSPRRSFAQWHQLVEGTAEPWTMADLAAARLIGESVADVVLQFRAVRTLVAQDQLAQVRDQVGRSEQPVILGDAEGRIILMNDACTRLLAPSVLHRIADLAACCDEPDDVTRRLLELVGERRPWRGEIAVAAGPLLIRADPIFSSPDRLLGFVLLFTDLAERKAGEAARRQFQDGIVAGYRLVGGPLATQPDLTFQTLLASIEENAQLAALEITDGIELAEVPRMLDSVRSSVARAAEVLAHLIRHGETAENDP